LGRSATGNKIVGIKTDARCASEIKPRTVMAKAAFNQGKKIKESHIWCVPLCVAKFGRFAK